MPRVVAKDSAAWRPFGTFKGRLSSKTYEQATIKKNLPKSPFTPRDCYVVCKLLKEQTNIPGFEIVGVTEGGDKDKEVDAVVLASGPGYRVQKGNTPYHYHAELVRNQTKRGDLVYFLERAGHAIVWEDGETYYLIEEHKLYFAIDKDNK